MNTIFFSAAILLPGDYEQTLHSPGELVLLIYLTPDLILT